MRIIKQSNQFKRDLKRESQGAHRQSLQSDFVNVVKLLANDASLPAKYRDHMLTGNWSDHRDCHIKPDLILIYRKTPDMELNLVRLGSHSQLGL